MKALFISKNLSMEPLGLMYLSAAAKKADHEVQLVRAEENLEEKVKEYRPDVVGYSVMTGDQRFYLGLNQALKDKFNFISLFGGPHATFFPKLIEEEGVDVICRGEGESAFVALLDSLKKNEDIRHIPNLSVKQNGKITINDLADYQEIDRISCPDRMLVAGIPGVGDSPIMHFIASRGCPFHCSYCFNEKYGELYNGKGKRVRFRNPASVVDEVKSTMKGSSARFVYFQDDTFTLNTKWLRDFSEIYAREVYMPFHCHIRANTLDEEKASLLKKAGCYSVHIAAESGNDRIRNELLNRNMTREQIIAASQLLKNSKIKFMMQNILGLPTGGIEDDISTLEMNICCQPDYAWVSIFQPYPGTKLGEFCRERGYYTGSFDDLASNFYDGSQLDFPEKYKNQLVNLQNLFAIFVEYPELHRMGLSRAMIDADRTPEIAKIYKNAYGEFRKKGNERLYGFSI